MRSVLALTLAAVLAAGATVARAADPASDAPEGPVPRAAAVADVPSYTQALQVWRTPEDLNGWIGARFEYDPARAMLLSESQRDRSGPVAIPSAPEFFAAPSGICVDLSRFAVETLRRIAPDVKARYLMIEFAPVQVAGHTLRRHWLAAFTRDGKEHFFADSKRPGHLAGPYTDAAEFVAEYATYRSRRIVAFRELESYQRQPRTLAAKQARGERPAP